MPLVFLLMSMHTRKAYVAVMSDFPKTCFHFCSGLFSAFCRKSCSSCWYSAQKSVRHSVTSAVNYTCLASSLSKTSLSEHHHHHHHHKTGLTWCKHSSASGPRYKVSVTHVASVRKSWKTDTSSTQYGMMSRLALM